MTIEDVAADPASETAISVADFNRLDRLLRLVKVRFAIDDPPNTHRHDSGLFFACTPPIPATVDRTLGNRSGEGRGDVRITLTHIGLSTDGIQIYGESRGQPGTNSTRWPLAAITHVEQRL